MNIAVFGLGYVGSTLAVMLSRRNRVRAVDIDPDRREALSKRLSPIDDKVMNKVLQEELDLSVTADPAEALEGADYVVVATDTKLDHDNQTLKTASVENVVEKVAAHFSDAKDDALPYIVIKSTVPVGFTGSLKEKYPGFTFLFCPEFLRMKTAMADMLCPCRIIVGFDEGRDKGLGAHPADNGGAKTAAESLAEIIQQSSDTPDVPVLFTGTKEAEAIKLFSNSYLATRVAFFNELDTFARERGLDSEDMIQGVCLDPRIGNWYNQPSPGYGGDCLPKDIAQLIADFGDIPETLFRGVVESNEIRKKYFDNSEI